MFFSHKLDFVCCHVYWFVKTRTDFLGDQLVFKTETLSLVIKKPPKLLCRGFWTGGRVVRKQELCNYSVVKWHEVATFAMADCASDRTAKKFCGYFKYDWLSIWSSCFFIDFVLSLGAFYEYFVAFRAKMWVWKLSSCLIDRVVGCHLQLIIYFAVFHGSNCL